MWESWWRQHCCWCVLTQRGSSVGTTGKAEWSTHGSSLTQRVHLILIIQEAIHVERWPTHLLHLHRQHHWQVNIVISLSYFCKSTAGRHRCITLLYTVLSEGNMASGGRRTRKSSAMFCRIIFLLSDSSSSSSSTENKSDLWRPDNPLNSQINVTLLFSPTRGCFAGDYDCPSSQCMTVIEQKWLTAVVTGNTDDEGISSVFLGGSPDPRNQLMSLGSSDGSTLLRSCFTSDFASEKFIFTIIVPLSPVLWIIC